MGREKDEEERSFSHHALDRSKVRILLCDNDPKSSHEVLQLLCKCSYQVIMVNSARRVIDVLNAQGSEIDIILAEVELPMAKGFKMMKYIARNKELRHISLIMMSARDEVSVVVKCLRLGAADYLVKPLRMNELLNLWTHMWRRRRMLGLREKDVFNQDFEASLSDPSDANTNSTILISDDTNDQPSITVDPELNISNHPECESNLSPMGPACIDSLDDAQNVPTGGDCAVSARATFSLPKKMELKVGESSAFLIYAKSSTPSKTPHTDVSNSALSQPLIYEANSPAQGDTGKYNNKLAQESYTAGNGIETSEKVLDIRDFQTPPEYPVLYLSSSTEQPQPRNEGTDVSGIPPMFPFPFYYRGVMNQNIIPSPGQMQAHAASAMLPQYSVVPYMPMMPPPFPRQPSGTNSQSNHMAAPSMRSAMTRSSTPEVQSGRTERRAAALVKFRQKRKDRCFEKKIRYEKRKSLAESRPRVRGQFVKQADNIDLNHNMCSGGDGESDDDEDNEPTSRGIEIISSPEQSASG